MSDAAPLQKSCLLFLSHHTRPGAMRALEQISEQCSDLFDVIPIFDQTHDRFPIHQISPAAVAVTTEALEAALPYPLKNAQHKGTLWPYNIDLPLLWFFTNNRHYSNYWLIEYDVRYSGHWPNFFQSFAENRSDLLAITIFDFDFRPTWGHWGTFRSTEDIPLSDRVRATLSFYRLSNRALVTLDEAYRSGAAGHYEVAIPTILTRAGLKIEDIGGSGAYVAPGNHNKFYTNSPQTPGLSPGTFVLHPEGMVKDHIPNMLWNPFKD
jgi:hypothetical protein